MSGGSVSTALLPTFHGFVQNSMDGLLLFEACLSGKLHHVPRRPHDRERTSLIKSGSIFIYEENASGIKRWTDGVAWSPSRILGNFLIYRELEKPFPPGEKKRAMKRKRSSQGGEFPGNNGEDAEANDMMPPTPPSPKPVPDRIEGDGQTDNDRELERQLIGSLVDSYGFRPDGLVKKTMSIAINGISHHLVSYYKIDEVKNKLLNRPVNDPRLQGMTIRPDLYLKQNFRTPVEETEHYLVDGTNNYAMPHNPYAHVSGGQYHMRLGQPYMGPERYGMYAPPGSSAAYGGTHATAWPTHQAAPVYQNQAYAPQYAPDYYGRTGSSTPQAAPARSDDHASSPATYSSQYSFAPRNSQAVSYPMVQPHYQAPMRPPTQGYMASSQPPQSAAPTAQSYAGTPTQGQSYAGTPTQGQSFDSKMQGQPYMARSPAQNYPPQTGTPTSVSQRQGVKSPSLPSVPPISSLGQHSQIGAPMPYRHPTYQSQEGHAAGDASGLGISSSYQGGSQPATAPYAGQASYSGYSSAPQNYRSGAADGATSVPTAGNY